MAVRLIVNADDFGLTRDVNAGIVAAHRDGILTSTTLMASGPAFKDAVAAALANPGLDVGCHLVLVGGRSVARPDEALPASLAALALRLARGWPQAAIVEEASAQIERLLAAGIRPSHLDAHKHAHLAPPLLDAVLAVARKYSIPRVRRPFDLPLTAAWAGASLRRRLLRSALRGLDGWFERKLTQSGLGAVDYFAGFQMTGRYRSEELARLIRALPDGVTEFMCHPGYCREELRASETRLKQSREEELRALTSAEVRRAVEERGVELISFRDLAAPDAPS